MKQRLAIIFVIGIVSVIAATWASAAFSLLGHQRSLVARSLRVANAVRNGYDRDTKNSETMLTHVCTRDVQVVRMVAELAAGATSEDAQRMALSLDRALAADVWLLLEHGSALTVLGASEALPAQLPSANALGAASGRPIIMDDGQEPRLVTACARQVGNNAFWVVRSEPLARARAGSIDKGSATFLDLPSHENESDDHHADAIALRIPRADAGLHEIWLRVSEAPHFDGLLTLLPMALLAVIFGGGLAYFAALTRAPVDDAVLVQLEQAAERIAKGDLSARIGPRSAGRADQTFRTFDRMTEELSEMRSKLAEAERAAAWQDMARRIAHEIKNPLSPIQLAIETLRKAHDKKLPAFDEIFDESTRAIAEEVKRIEHIVQEFSDFARLPRAKPGALQLSSLIADTVSLYQPDDVAIDVQDETGETLVRADREQITQVLVNLIQNATDAARSASEPKVALSTETSRGMALVHVDDNGRGIPPGDRERVFEPYFTTKEHGTGLGLAIVRRIALNHQGQIAIGDSPLGGARFTLKLPLQV